jgi:FkbM family methyltransferase
MSTIEAERSSERATTKDAFLGGALKIYQPRNGYRAGIDPVLLAGLVAPEAPGPVLDVGAGVGVVGLCVASRCPDTNVVLFEREPWLAELARRNACENGLGARVSVLEADIASPNAALENARISEGTFPVVLANPPFHDENRGTSAESRLKATSHQMPEAALDVWVRFMCRMTAPGGRAAIIHKAEAISQVLAAYERRFGAVRVLPIHARAGEPAIRVIVEGVKGSRAPVSIRAGLVLHGSDGKFLPGVQDVLRNGAALAGVSGG